MTARSDFFLVSAVLLFGSLLSSVLRGLIPIDIVQQAIDYALVPALLIITPIWLQRTRKQPLSDLYRGNPKHLAMGAIIALPVVLGILAVHFSTGGFGLIIGGNEFFIPILLKWVSLGIALTFLIQRAEIAFPGDGPFNYVSLRLAGIMIGLGVLGGLGMSLVAVASSPNLSSGLKEGAIAAIPVGAALSWVLAERILNLSGNVPKSAWYTVAVILFLAEVNIFNLLTNWSALIASFVMLAPLSALAMVIMAAWDKERSALYGYGMALVYGLVSVPGNAVFV